MVRYTAVARADSPCTLAARERRRVGQRDRGTLIKWSHLSLLLSHICFPSSTPVQGYPAWRGRGRVVWRVREVDSSPEAAALNVHGQKRGPFSGAPALISNQSRRMWRVKPTAGGASMRLSEGVLLRRLSCLVGWRWGGNVRQGHWGRMHHFSSPK